LTPASRRQDHTTSPSAATSLVSAFVDRSRVEPALRSRRAQNAAASTASHPASVTIAIRPSWGRDGGGCRTDLGQLGREIFLQMGLDRKSAEPPVGQISWPFRRSSTSGGGRRNRLFIVGERYRSNLCRLTKLLKVGNQPDHFEQHRVRARLSCFEPVFVPLLVCFIS
jgi:hypothetical protein